MTELPDAIKDHKEAQTRNNTIFIADREPATSETMQELYNLMTSEKLAANSIVTIPDYSAPEPTKPYTMTDRQVRARLGLCKPDHRDEEELDKLVKQSIEHYLH